MLPDHQFVDTDLAALYDRFHPWNSRDDLAFYLPMVLDAGAVLDVGCGTGMLLHHARDAGHTGRLCGLDPGDGMLAVARTRTDVEWVRGTLATVTFDGEFDLVVMSGHAFQVLVTDEEVRAALTAVRAALVPGGRFAFETRDPAARAWENWIPANAVTLPGGERMTHQVEPLAGDGTVSFTTTYTSPQWTAPATSHSTLRFLNRGVLGRQLADAGLEVTAQYGDWHQNLEGPEIVTIALRDHRR